MSTTTATVETLTAEVRTLVVGARQVTLSVAKQLDVVPIEQLRVMGRVKITLDGDHVIGTAPNGSLALAKYRYPFYQPLWVHLDEFDGDVVICRGTTIQGYGYDTCYELRIRDIDHVFRVPSSQVKFDCDHYPSRTGPKCEGWRCTNLPLLATLVEVEAAKIAMLKEAHKAASESPLIVLAGLK